MDLAKVRSGGSVTPALVIDISPEDLLDRDAVAKAAAVRFLAEAEAIAANVEDEIEYYESQENYDDDTDEEAGLHDQKSSSSRAIQDEFDYVTLQDDLFSTTVTTEASWTSSSFEEALTDTPRENDLF